MVQPFPSSTYKGTTMFTALPSSSCTLAFVIFLCMLGFYFLHHPQSKTTPHHSENALRFQEIFLSSSTNYTLSSYLRSLTLQPHLAGTKPALRTTQYVLNHFKDLGLDSHTQEFQALLSYPVHSSLSVHFNDGTSKELLLTEAGQVGNDVVTPYHAYSPSGSAFTKVVFVNYGRDDDYGALAALGVNVSGYIAIARKGDVPRRKVVEKAGEKGAVAVLLYADGDKFNGVERGTVMSGLGDPLSPGWAGVEGGEKLGLESREVVSRFPEIPSMPISFENAETILTSLEGARVPYGWRDTLRSRVVRVGPGPTLVNFTYQGEQKLATVHNVFAIIRGWEEPDHHILLGNHRDAWTYGAVDPNSGTAALLDIARRYTLMLRSGWVPRRSIVLCSWDAEEFGMIGSTEWVEQNILNLHTKAVAYLNVDCAVQGPGFFVGATPQLDNLIIEVTKKIKDPDSEGMVVYQTWAATNEGINIQRLDRADSDFAPFLQHAGVPSIDLYYGKDFPVYHTAFDSYDWITKYGDPLFHRHVAVANLWGLLAIHLVDDPILPFNYLSYAARLQEHANALSNMLDDGLSVQPIITSIQILAKVAEEVEEETQKLKKQENTIDLLELELKSQALNNRLMLAERGFLDAEGLQGRPWFKHLVYGPPEDSESMMVFFPGVADAISRARKMPKREGKSATQHEIWRVARAIQRAATALKGELT